MSLFSAVVSTSEFHTVPMIRRLFSFYLFFKDWMSVIAGRRCIRMSHAMSRYFGHRMDMSKYLIKYHRPAVFPWKQSISRPQRSIGRSIDPCDLDQKLMRSIDSVGRRLLIWFVRNYDQSIGLELFVSYSSGRISMKWNFTNDGDAVTRLENRSKTIGIKTKTGGK